MIPIKDNKEAAFTLTEVLVAVVIVGVIAALVLPAVISHYQENSFDKAFQRETQTIQSAIDGLAVNENKASFFETMMYTSAEPISYTDSAEKFIKIYLRPSKLCGDNNGDCFATTYYEYKDNDKSVYNPEYKGSCAKLKNGASICLTSQIQAQPIAGIIDINGEKGPNILNKDLRLFTLETQTQTDRNTEVAAVLETPFTPIQEDEEETDPCEGMTCGCGSLPDCDPCAGKTCGCGTLPDCPVECSSNPIYWNSTCCRQNSSAIDSPSHRCCTYSSIKSDIYNCRYHCVATVTGTIKGSSGRVKFDITGNGADQCFGFSYTTGRESKYLGRNNEYSFNPKNLCNLCLNVNNKGYGPCKFSLGNYSKTLYNLMGNGNFSFTLERDYDK